MVTISAHFDGRVIVPDEPVELPIGKSLRVKLEVIDQADPPFSDLLSLEADLPDAPSDLSSQHDHYLYGTPKR